MKRTLLKAILCIAVILFSCFPVGRVSCVGAEDPATDAESLRAFLEGHYGVTILMGNECSDVPKGNFEYSVIPQGTTPFQQMAFRNSQYLNLLMVMDDAFSLYSHAFYENMAWYGVEGGIRFLLVDELIWNGQHINGFSTYTGKDYFDIWLSSEYVREWVIHHEMWHTIETRIRCEEPEAFSAWTELNPEGFEYTGIFSGTGDPEGKPAGDWFVREYSKADEYEDRATVFEMIMLRDGTWWEGKPHLLKKADALTEWCRKLGVFDE